MGRVLALFLISLFTSFQTPSAKTGVVEGRVMREGTTEPISGVLITLVVPGGPSSLSPETLEGLRRSGLIAGQSVEQVQTGIVSMQRSEGASSTEPAFVLTDTSGKFTFRDVPAGRYTVRAEREAFVAAQINENYQTGAVKTVTVTENKTSSSELFLIPSGIISGLVRDPLGQPAVGVSVGVFRLIYGNGRHAFAGGRSVVTDDRGQYRISYVAPGYLYVGVTPRNNTPGSPEESWERTFYPGVLEPEKAERISVTIGGENTNINIDLRSRVRTHKISGRAINNAAVPNPTTGVIDRSVSNFYLTARNTGLLDLAPNYTNTIPVSARPNGEFEIRDVRPGSYELSAYYVDPTTRRSLLNHIPIDVRDDDIAGVLLAISPGVTLAGEVQVRGGAADSVRFQSLQLALQSAATSNLPVPTTAIPVDASGRFNAEHITELKYRLQVTGLPQNAYVADVLQGGISVFDTGFELDGKSAPLQIIVNADGQPASGTVTTAAGEPVAGATVVLVPPEAQRQNPLRFKTATSDEQGRFAIRGVPAGQFTIFAWESIYPSSWLNSQRLERSADRGRPVTIAIGGRSDLQLRSIPAGN